MAGISAAGGGGERVSHSKVTPAAPSTGPPRGLARASRSRSPSFIPLPRSLYPPSVRALFSLHSSPPANYSFFPPLFLRSLSVCPFLLSLSLSPLSRLLFLLPVSLSLFLSGGTDGHICRLTRTAGAVILVSCCFLIFAQGPPPRPPTPPSAPLPTLQPDNLQPAD